MESNPYLSLEILECINARYKNNGFDVAALEKGTMFDVATMDVNFTMVVTNPEQREVALISTMEKIAGPDIWIVIGSEIHKGGLLATGWIGEGFNLAMQRIAGGSAETSPVKSFTFNDEPEKARRIVEEAEARRPRTITPDEAREHERNFRTVVKGILRMEFPKKRTLVSRMTYRFGNKPAQAKALGVLSQAQKHGKFDQAIVLLNRDWRQHWVYQAPEIAGNPNYLRNAAIWEKLYEELGIPLR